MANRPSEWLVLRPPHSDPPTPWPKEIASWSDIEPLERRLRFDAGTPIVLNPEGLCDPVFTRFLNSGSFRSLARGSQDSYLIDYRLYFTFLWTRDTDWRDATADDIDDYEHWRRRDADNPGKISGGRWNRGLAAITRLYDWAIGRGEISSSPVLKRRIIGYRGFEIDVPVARSTDYRPSDVKWMTPRAYRLWRDVGLRGYDNAGLIRTAWQGRCDGRDVAFADLLSESGLRRREAGAQLTIEIPTAQPGQNYPHGWVATAIAKRSRRYYWVSRKALSEIASYCETTRAEAVQSAQRFRRYDGILDKKVVIVSPDKKTLYWCDDLGREFRMSVDLIDAEQRRLLYVNTARGLEPLALWLTEAGLPMHYTTWNNTFRKANERCKAAGIELWCTPKMLRHSFALRMLIQIQYAFSRSLDLSAKERDTLRELYGDAWALVKDLLGHRSVELTKSIYLEPVRGLSLELMFVDEDPEDASDLIVRVAHDMGLVLDIAL